MTGLLSRLLAQFICYVQTGVTLVLNATIEGLGSLYSHAIDLLPDMPDYPTLPDAVLQGTQYAYYLIDLGWLLGYMASFFTLLLIVFVVMVLLRWARVVE